MAEDTPIIVTSDAAVANPDEKTFLQIYLQPDQLLLLPVQYLVEITTCSLSQLVPLFQMPPWVMGVLNWRGDILWMVDLAHFLGFAPWYERSEQPSKLTAVVIQAAATEALNADEQLPTVGLLVRLIDGMVTCPVDQLQTSDSVAGGAVAPAMEAFVAGYWQQSKAHPILDGAAVLAALSADQASNSPFVI